MSRFSHGAEILLNDLGSATEAFRELAVLDPATSLGGGRFGFMFPKLQSNPANRLPEHPSTARKLRLLGEAMEDPDPLNPVFDSTIPAAYSYFGQFVDHDVTLEAVTRHVPLDDSTMPVQEQEIYTLRNIRSAALDLDSVYGPAIDINGNPYLIPRDGEKFVIARAIGGPPNTDLPRDPDPDQPHPAMIGDRRNDQHLIISQMHLAFLRLHNSLVSRGDSFEEARRLVRQHYQWIVIKEFLPNVADAAIVQRVMQADIEIFDPPDDSWAMPLEFSVAAFRFGHSMIRDVYNYNEHFDGARLFQILLPGPLTDGYHHIFSEWVIDWARFLPDGANKGRRIDTCLAEGLSRLDDGQGKPLKHGLAVLDLLRGYLLRLPTGQAVARELGLTPMTAPEIEAAAGPKQAAILQSSGLSKDTPLWFYILVEARASAAGRLGELGSILIASVLLGMLRRSKDSYIRYRNWTPSLGKGGDFQLADLFRLAGVLPNA